MFRYILGIDSD